MGGTHRQPRRYLLMTAAAALALATAPAHAAPAAPFPQAPAPDPTAMVAQVGPAVVNINIQMGYQSAVGAGTGIVIDPGGVVLTNNHVITGATNISAVAIGNGQTYDVDVLGFDRSHDVAVVQLRGGGGLPAANIGNSSSVAVGDPVVAMGNAGGGGGTPSAVSGNVVALNQTVAASDELTGSTETLDGMIQANAPIRQGDSGGPMVNSAGQVIGMNTAASDNYKIPEQGGQGFAIPIDQAMAIARQIRAGAASSTVHIGDTAFLGVGVSDGNGGARVVRVLENTPAAEAGLQVEDVLTAVDNVPVNSATTLTTVLDQRHPGDVITLTWRSASGGVHTQSLTLAPGPVG